MHLLWFVVFGCTIVSAEPIGGGENVQAHLSGQDSDSDTVTSTFHSTGDRIENRTNGVSGWYVPQSDGSLQWMSMETIEEIQSSPDVALYSTQGVLINPFSSVKFWLYSELSPEIGEEMSSRPIDIETSGFNPAHRTYFVAHGFLQTKYSFSLNRLLRNALFQTAPINFIYIEWADAKTFNYLRSSKRVPAVGKLTAQLFDTLVQNYKMDCEKTHLVGHSLGAHVVGFAAKNIRSCQIPRITALDPALPLFPYDKPAERLNSSDARYVESIHTNGDFYGHKEPIGTASFYCNGGERQPGCGLALYNVCCHERSVHYFREAVVKNNFPANKCGEYRDALKGKCLEQYSGVSMADGNNDLVARGVYLVNTNDKSPYGR